MVWHLLQVSDVLDIEFGSALAERVPLLAWEPVRTIWAPFFLKKPAQVRRIKNPPLTIHSFPLMPGYARAPLSLLANTGSTVSRCLLRETDEAANAPLICTTPYMAPVAERWPGPVVYWLTDRMECYGGANASLIHRLDRKMCRAATLVCPNSLRLADYLKQWGECPEKKIHILPNATRKSNLLPQPPAAPGALPYAIKDLPRPVAGVIGNLAGNMDWLFIETLIRRVPNTSWVFVGPTSMSIKRRDQSDARERVMKMKGTHFVGKQAYGDLADYARCFDVALLPYLRCEPTYSGSSTRFYEHLAACRPMIATKGFEELTRKEPFLRLVDDADEAANVFAELRSLNFNDGLSELRWQESQNATWQARAGSMQCELKERLHASH